MAKVQVKMPEEFLLRLSRLGDKTDEIINNSTSTESSYTDSSTFSPHISISLGGGGKDVDIDGLDSHILELLEKWYREKKEDEYHNRAMQGAYARS